MNHDDACAAVRPLLFAAIEGDVTAAERTLVHAHLAACAACASAHRDERALTALLRARAVPGRDLPRRVVRGPSRLLGAATAVACAATALLLLPSATPRGTVSQRGLGPDLEWRPASERALAAHDVVDVPAAFAATLRLGDGVELDAVGPARLAVAASDRGWTVDVLRGIAVAAVGERATLAAGGGAARRLGAGHWLLAPGLVRQQLQQDPQDPHRDTAALVAEGVQRFGSARPVALGGSAAAEREQLQAAERLLRAAVAAADATPEQHRRALFYLAASVSRQGREAESFALNEEWLLRYPDGEEASLVRHYMACHLRAIGEEDRATALFERVARDERGTPLGDAARACLETGAGRNAPQPPPEPPPAVMTARLAPGERAQGGYLVVVVDLHEDRAADRGYLAAAAAARAFHGGAILAWDGVDVAALARQLRERMPAAVLFVLRPERLDLVLHRRLLLACAGLDADWFVDVAFGYLTAEDGAGCAALWRRIETVHRRGTLAGTWWEAGVIAGPASTIDDDAAPPLVAAAGFHGTSYRYATGDARRDAVVARSLADLQRAAVVQFTGCGDPQGIWLFDDRRNLQRERHWDYAPDRVGQDPDGSMPRLLAPRFRTLRLDAPILWSGTCHSGAVCRVFVEGDIVSTFGRTKRATVHRLRPEDSLACSWLAAGAASMLVPLGANHGMSVLMEVDFALRNGASLGETIKSTWDDVLLAAQGELVLDLPVEGEPHGGEEQVMQGGGSNRILIGDPALRPFAKVDSAAEQVRVERTGEGCRVTVVRAAGWQPRAWDMFGTDRARDHRVLVRVDLTALGLADRGELSARVAATAPDGAVLPYTMQRVALEDHAGRRWLHLQANGPRDVLDRKAATIVFDVE